MTIDYSIKMEAVYQVVWVFMLAVTFRAAQGSISCKDMNGNDVDWFYIYKIPRMKLNKIPLIQKGVAFYYLDINQQTFQLSNVSLSDEDHPVAQTLNQIYDQQDEIASVMYNDEWPDGKKSETRGHTKGVVAFDSSTGFWLVHSVPRFPSNSSYSWPSNAMYYGQSMLCVTYKSSSMEDIGESYSRSLYRCANICFIKILYPANRCGCVVYIRECDKEFKLCQKFSFLLNRDLYV